MKSPITKLFACVVWCRAFALAAPQGICSSNHKQVNSLCDLKLCLHQVGPCALITAATYQNLILNGTTRSCLISFLIPRRDNPTPSNQLCLDRFRCTELPKSYKKRLDNISCVLADTYCSKGLLSDSWLESHSAR